MITIRLAKSILEHEEGMNHIWVQIAPLGEVEHATLQVLLPAGIHLANSISQHHDQDSSGRFIIDKPNLSHDILLEIFTLEPINCGELTITCVLAFIDKAGVNNCHSFAASITVTDEEEAGNILIDEEVVRRVKQGQYKRNDSNDSILDCTPVKIIRYDSHYCSELEKQYRVQGSILNGSR